ncbi:MAG: hypothetical protein ACRETL_13830 [Gammaproteobacteria bacterium]
MARAETVLEAIARSSALTVRGIEGIIAEASFATEVLPMTPQLRSIPIDGDQAFDFLLADGTPVSPIRIQVKMQRRRNHIPMRANEVERARRWPPDQYVVELQRTRGGTRRARHGAGDGDSAGASERTRPYRFGQFDILAVSLGASTGRWSNFIYAPELWLLADPADPALLLKYQPVSASTDSDWTTDLLQVIQRVRKATPRKIRG